MRQAHMAPCLVFMVHIEHLATVLWSLMCESVPEHLARYFTSLVFMVYYLKPAGRAGIDYIILER